MAFVDPDGFESVQQALRSLLNGWDPIGIYDPVLDYPPDEYDCLIGPLLTLLGGGADRAELGEFLWHEIEDHFGLDPVLARTDSFADKLLLWFSE